MLSKACIAYSKRQMLVFVGIASMCCNQQERLVVQTKAMTEVAAKSLQAFDRALAKQDMCTPCCACATEHH